MAKDQEFSDEETTRRANEAIRRAFAMPHKPQEPIGKTRKSPAKVVRKRRQPVK